MSHVDEAIIAAAFREHSAKAIASLTRAFGDLGLAEDMVQEAFLQATRRWPQQGLPPNLEGWIITVARNRAIDHLRRQQRSPHHVLALPHVDEPLEPAHVFGTDDDLLRLIFTCAHPALPLEARVALTLRVVGGLETHEIARAFMVPEATLAQRIVRAKRKIRDTHLPYKIPETHELPERLGAVMAIIYLIFNEGYLPSHGDLLLSEPLCERALWLAQQLHKLLPDEPEVLGLLALITLHHARRSARTDKQQQLIPLAEQDRGLWERASIDKGLAMVRRCLTIARPGLYQLQASIVAIHCAAPSAAQTDWAQIVAAYELLLRLYPTPIIKLNHAIALGELSGPSAALTRLASLELDDYHLYHVACAEQLAKQGHIEGAISSLERALRLAQNKAERLAIEGKLDKLRHQVA